MFSGETALFIDNSVRVLYNFNCPNSNNFKKGGTLVEQVINLLDSGKRHGYQLTLLACIVNQTHRLAISMPTEEALDGMPI